MDEMIFHDEWFNNININFDNAYDAMNENEIESYTMNDDKIYEYMIDMSCENSEEFYNLQIKRMRWLKSAINKDSGIVKMNHEREFKERQDNLCNFYSSELNNACGKSGFKFSEVFNVSECKTILNRIIELYEEKILDEKHLVLLLLDFLIFSNDEQTNKQEIIKTLFTEHPEFKYIITRLSMSIKYLIKHDFD